MDVVDFRRLQFSAGGAAGGVFVGTPDCNEGVNCTGTSSSGGGGSGFFELKNIFFIILSVVALVVCGALITYIVSVILDKVNPPNDQEFDHGQVSRKAGLWGLTMKERAEVLDQLFESSGKIFDYKQQEHAVPEDSFDRDKESEGNSSEPDDDPALEEGIATVTTKSMKPEVESLDDVDIEASVKESKSSEVKTEGIGDEESIEKVDSDHERAQDLEAQAGEDISEESHDGMDLTRVCCICLVPYEEDCKVMTGFSCSHMYHHECCMEWLQKHDHCPYCRTEMMSPAQFRQAAKDALGEDRVETLGVFPGERGETYNSNPNAQGDANDDGEGVELTVHAVRASQDEGGIEADAGTRSVSEQSLECTEQSREGEIKTASKFLNENETHSVTSPAKDDLESDETPKSLPEQE